MGKALKLFVDTSSSLGMTSLIDSEDKILGIKYFSSSFSHSEKLFISINELIKESGFDIKDLIGFYYIAGPGSFTGLRIAYSVANGFNISGNMKTYGISSLDVLVENISFIKSSKITICTSNQNEVFAYGVDKENKTILKKSNYTISDISSFINEFNDEIYIVGASLILEINNKNVKIIKNQFLNLINPFSMLNVANKGLVYDEVLYLKDSYARK